MSCVILVVEPDPILRKGLKLLVRAQGYEIAESRTGTDAIAKTLNRVPDAILLSLQLPDADGIRVLMAIRERTQIPIIALSTYRDEAYQIQALDAGADDYVVKPFREGELMARLRAALRAAESGTHNLELVVGELRLDLIKHRVFVRSREVVLTPTEFKLLHILASEAGRVLSHAHLLREVWGPSRVNEIQYLRVYMNQLREKLEDDPMAPTRILTTPGIGYRLARGEVPPVPALATGEEQPLKPNSEPAQAGYRLGNIATRALSANDVGRTWRQRR